MTMAITASAEFIKYLMNLAQQTGVDPEEVYAEVGFDSTALDIPGARFPYDQFDMIWNAAEEKSLDPYIGLHMGEKVFNFPGHILFMLIQNASDIKSAIEKGCQYFNLLNDIITPAFSMNQNTASITIRLHTSDFKTSRHIFEGLLAAYSSLLYRLSENKIQFQKVSFVHARPENISEHQRIFHAPLYFNEPENKLVFSAEYLDLPIELSDREVFETLELLAQKLQERLYTYGPWSEKVSKIMMNLLKGEKPEIESIAGRLAISPRHLQNHLKNEGITYRALLDNVRKEKAIYFLKNTNVSINEIAYLLGYSEQSSFNKAFKRWLNLTPREIRSQRGH